MFDVIIVGGGPAGLSAALILGRCRRRVLVCDAGHPRNERSLAVHGFLSRDGTPPAELLDCARQQLRPYTNVTMATTEVITAEQTAGGFAVTLPDGSRKMAAKLLFAIGVIDELPAIPVSKNSMAAVSTHALTATAGNGAAAQWRFTDVAKRVVA
jgi:thioredoxin reductase